MSMYPPFTAEHAEARMRQLRRDAEDARAVALAKAGPPTGGTETGRTRLRLVTSIEAPQTADRHRRRGIAARLRESLARTAGRSGAGSRVRGGGVPCTSSELR